MKNTINNFLGKAALAVASLMVFSIAAFAQVNPATFPTEGSATMSSQVSPSVQLSTFGGTAITGDMQGTGGSANGNSSGTGSPINSTLNFGEVSTNNTTANPFVLITMGAQVRSNCSYTIRARRGGSASLPDGAGNSGEFKTGDIGFGISNVNAGTSLSYPGAQNGTISGTTALGFYNTNLGATPLTNSQPTYPKSLNNIGTTATPIVSGTRISNGGDNSTYLNRLTLTMNFAVKPQYYGVGASNAVIHPTETLTFDIVPNP